jgi:hypothetical protein
LDLPDIKKPEDEMLQDVAKVISSWNLNRTYDVVGKNCQNFVEDLIKNGLGIDTTNLYSEFNQQVIDNLHKFGEYKIENIFKNFPDFKNLKNHSDLDYILNMKEIQGSLTLDELNLGKSLDRAFWFNNFSLEQYKEFFVVKKNEFEKSKEKLEIYDEEELMECLNYIFEIQYLKKYFDKEIIQLKKLYKKWNDNSDCFKEIEPDLMNKLREIYDKFIKIAEEKIPVIDVQLKINQPITGREFIRRYYKDLFSNDVFQKKFEDKHSKESFKSIKKEYQTLYKDVEYPIKSDVEKFIKRHHEKISDIYPKEAAILWKKYDEECCYLNNPELTFSIKKKY